MPRQLRREEYTIGWVCALHIELAAAQEMLDEEHNDIERDFGDNDENLYVLGSIGGHNIVIVCLPAGRIGNNPAAAVAAQMRATFKGIRFGLMVGIGGGVPSAEADIRLGDVVISQPHYGFSGVVQYDSGKATPSGLRRTGSLNSPPGILLAAVNRWRAKELRGKSRLADHLSTLNRIPHFRRDRAGADVLFMADYEHEGGQTCETCDISRQVARLPRETEDCVVMHYGTIASGNLVMRSAAERDIVSAELDGVLCFEMEAAGLMNNFPCLVVRGICDYADSHKNKRWQAYAAATAAACAKELLNELPPTDVVKAPAQKTAPTQMPGVQETKHFGGSAISNGTSSVNQPPALNPAISQGLFASPESLCRAIQRGDVEGVQALIASCFDSVEILLTPVLCADCPVFVENWKAYWGISRLDRRVTALHCAVENAGENSLRILRMILQVLPASALDPVGYINIIHAINTRSRLSNNAQGNTPGIYVALEAEPDGKYMQSCTVLTWAAMLGNYNAINLLKDAGVFVNTRSNWLRVTPLMAQCLLTAFTPGAPMVTVSLLRGGALLDLQDDLGNSALHLALAAGNADIAMALLNAGAAVDLPNRDHLRASHMASDMRYRGYIREDVRTAILAKRFSGAISFGRQ